MSSSLSTRFGSNLSTNYEEEDGDSSSVKPASDDHHREATDSDDLFVSGQGNGNAPILPPPELFHPEEGVALRLWRRENAIRLEEKEKREKELLSEIIGEAEEYKAEFYRKWKLWVENNKVSNREKEKLLLENQDKFHAEAGKNYWKAAAEMIPREVPTIEKRGKKKDQDKQPSIVVIYGPKPGKPTDLSRMRQVFVKLKHKPPPHMNPPPSTSSSASSSSIPREDVKAVASSPATSAPQKLQATAAPKSVTSE